ncbi:unnamed protein product, partial [Staurois parvus]
MYTVITYSLCPPRRVERVSPLSVGERTSPAPVSSAAVPKKPELSFTMRLGAQPLHHLCSPLENFSSHLASGRAAFSSPDL